jgi:hypothetical protein
MNANIQYQIKSTWGESEYDYAPLSIEDGRLKIVIDDREYFFNLEEMADLIALLQKAEEIRKKHRG